MMMIPMPSASAGGQVLEVVGWSSWVLLLLLLLLLASDREAVAAPGGAGAAAAEEGLGGSSPSYSTCRE